MSVEKLENDFATQEELESLTKEQAAALEELAKSCPRCGKPSANKANPAGRCRSCLNKLASNKKKVGHYLHEHKVADDALDFQRKIYLKNLDNQTEATKGQLPYIPSGGKIGRAHV